MAQELRRFRPMLLSGQASMLRGMAYLSLPQSAEEVIMAEEVMTAAAALLSVLASNQSRRGQRGGEWRGAAPTPGRR